VKRSPHPIQSEVCRGCPEKKKDEVCAHAGVAKFADRASKMSIAFSFAAGLDAFRRRPECTQDRVAAIGYCVGGCGALELARAGTPLRAVVSLHGILSVPIRAERNTVMPKELF
jgi:dienelactone hydrolase